MSDTNLYEALGGHQTFENLVSHFYALVAVDPILRPLYPDNDLHGAANRLMMFLEQYWGGTDDVSRDSWSIQDFECAMQVFILVLSKSCVASVYEICS